MLENKIFNHSRYDDITLMRDSITERSQYRNAFQGNGHSQSFPFTTGLLITAQSTDMFFPFRKDKCFFSPYDFFLLGFTSDQDGQVRS